MRRILLAICLVIACATGVGAGPSEEKEAQSAYASGDYARAASLIRPLAEQSHALAQNNLGLLYRDGMGVPKDEKEAVAWFRKAADQGFAPAQNNLGLMYANGRGMPQDYKQAALWFRRAADQGHENARANLRVVSSRLAANDLATSLAKATVIVGAAFVVGAARVTVMDLLSGGDSTGDYVGGNGSGIKRWNELHLDDYDGKWKRGRS